MQSESFPDLLAAIIAPSTRTTMGGAEIVTTTTRHAHIGSIVWTVQVDRNASAVIGSRIVCWEIAEDADGWTAMPLRESHRLEHVTCPLEWLDKVAVVSYEWRDRVWDWHQDELTRQIEGKVA